MPLKKLPQWNSYLTDLSHLSLSKEEILERKKRLVSKHNIFLNTNVSTKSKKRSVAKPKKINNTSKQVDEILPSKHRANETSNNYESDDNSYISENKSQTALDFLDSEYETTNKDVSVYESLSSPTQKNSLPKKARKVSNTISSSPSSTSNIKGYKSPFARNKTENKRSDMKKEPEFHSSEFENIYLMLNSLSYELKDYQKLVDNSNFDAEVLFITSIL
jgi:hypothetical protein